MNDTNTLFLLLSGAIFVCTCLWALYAAIQPSEHQDGEDSYAEIMRRVPRPTPPPAEAVQETVDLGPTPAFTLEERSQRAKEDDQCRRAAEKSGDRILSVLGIGLVLWSVAALTVAATVGDQAGIAMLVPGALGVVVWFCLLMNLPQSDSPGWK